MKSWEIEKLKNFTRPPTFQGWDLVRKWSWETPLIRTSKFLCLRPNREGIDKTGIAQTWMYMVSGQ